MKKNVLITGATSGIGEACARKFAQGGYNLTITGRNTTKLASMKAELEAAGSAVITLAFDVRDAKAAEAAISRLRAIGNELMCVSTMPVWPWVSTKNTKAIPKIGTQ